MEIQFLSAHTILKGESHLKQMSCGFSGRYPQYKYTIDQVRAEVKRGLLTPLAPSSSDPVGDKRIPCAICYEYFEVINLTKCCHNCICTDCIAAMFEPNKKRECPVCRQDLQVSVNKHFEDIPSDKTEEDHIPSPTSETPEFGPDVMYVVNITSADPAEIKLLLDAGIPKEEIISQFR